MRIVCEFYRECKIILDVLCVGVYYSHIPQHINARGNEPMTRHREPSVGYASEEKQAYRNKVWSTFSQAIVRANSGEGFILILPGLTCDEIETAISHGLNPMRLVLVHESAAHVATSAVWRKKYPGIKFYCTKVSKVAEKLIKNNQTLVAANLDFCGNFSLEMMDEISSFFDSAPMHFDATVAITMMKGRESPAVVKLIDRSARYSNSNFNFKEKRLQCMFSMFATKANGQVAWSVGEGAYVHNKAPMAWGVGRFTNDHEMKNYVMKIQKKAAGDVMANAVALAQEADDLYRKTEKESGEDILKYGTLVHKVGELVSDAYSLAESAPGEIGIHDHVRSKLTHPTNAILRELDVGLVVQHVTSNSKALRYKHHTYITWRGYHDKQAERELCDLLDALPDQIQQVLW